MRTIDVQHPRKLSHLISLKVFFFFFFKKKVKTSMIVIIIHLKNDKVMSRKKKGRKNNAVCVTNQDTITFRVSIIEPL